jgi:hypothetical protein
VEVHSSLTDQVELVAAPAQDAQLVADWLAYRNEWERLTWLSAKAFDAFKFDRWDKLIRRAYKVGNQEWDTVFLLGLSAACR